MIFFMWLSFPIKSNFGTVLSNKCWMLNMNQINNQWSGLTLRVGRYFPTLVSVRNKAYIMSGEIIDVTMEVVEVINLDTNTVETLTGPDGKDLQVDEFVNSTLSCAIALEDVNSFIITGGIWFWQRPLNKVVRINLEKNTKENLPSMTTSRYYHECSRIKRYGRDYIMVFGGEGSTGLLNSIELYDLTLRPATWEVWTGVSIPVIIGRLLGSVVMRFDDDYCNAMIVSLSAKMVLQCTGNHQWIQFDISSTITKGLKKMAKIDANFF